MAPQGLTACPEEGAVGEEAGRLSRLHKDIIKVQEAEAAEPVGAVEEEVMEAKQAVPALRWWRWAPSGSTSKKWSSRPGGAETGETAAPVRSAQREGKGPKAVTRCLCLIWPPPKAAEAAMAGQVAMVVTAAAGREATLLASRPCLI